MKATLLLLLTILLLSCTDKKNNTVPVVNLTRYEDTIDDTSFYSYSTLNYSTICKDLFIRSHTPEQEALIGKPDSYVEWISEYPNWTKEDYEEIFASSKGTMHVDTTDRDFEKFWYNPNGLLEKYANRRFGDIISSECLFLYNEDNSIKELQINDVLTEDLKFKNRTVKIGRSGDVLDIRHNILKK